jgi:hypothetical protein
MLQRSTPLEQTPGGGCLAAVTAPRTRPPSIDAASVSELPGEHTRALAATGVASEQRERGVSDGRRPAPVRAGRDRRWAPSPSLGRRELLVAALTSVLLAVITSWPLVLHLPSRIAPDLGDPVRTAWQVAWVGHAMLHSPLHIFNANAFYPHPLSLAFSDSLLGYGPAAFFGSGTVAALVRYNLLFLFAWALCFLGAYLLARELGLRALGAAAAAAAFAYAPYRVTEAGHLHVISSGGIPLALFLLLRGYRRNHRGLVLAGWLVSAWQVSLGFTLGLQYTYLLALIALLIAWRWWRVRAPEGSRSLAAAAGGVDWRRMLAVSCVGLAVVAAVGAYQARPYLKIANDYPTAKRTIKEVKNYSAGPAALLAAPAPNRVWGGATSGLRAHVHSKNESVFFPGGLLLILATSGLAAPFYTRRLRAGLALAAAGCAILALGLGLTGAGYPYRLLYDYAPGWNGVRVPGRVFTMTTLCLALLAGAGAQLWSERLRRRGGPRALPALAGAALAAALVVEGAGRLGHPVVPQPARAEIGLPAPLLDLPTDGPADRVWQYFSTNGFYPIPVGNSTFDIPAVDDLRGGMERFPDRASVEKLRYLGIKTVVLHLKMPKLPGIVGYALPEPRNVAAAAVKPVAGLGLTRRRVGSLVIYEIGPGPKALHS